MSNFGPGDIAIIVEADAYTSRPDYVGRRAKVIQGEYSQRAGRIYMLEGIDWWFRECELIPANKYEIGSTVKQTANPRFIRDELGNKVSRVLDTHWVKHSEIWKYKLDCTNWWFDEEGLESAEGAKTNFNSGRKTIGELLNLEGL